MVPARHDHENHTHLLHSLLLGQREPHSRSYALATGAGIQAAASGSRLHVTHGGFLSFTLGDAARLAGGFGSGDKSHIHDSELSELAIWKHY